MTKLKKVEFSTLKDNPNWRKAVIVFKQNNFREEYTEKQRSYLIENGEYQRGLDSSKMGSCLLGDCLDGTDNNVRLDMYNWEKEYCYIVE